MHNVTATFRNGQLELSQPVDWPDGIRVNVVPLLVEPVIEEPTLERQVPVTMPTESVAIWSPYDSTKAAAGLLALLNENESMTP